MFVLAYDDTEGNNIDSVDSFKKYFLPRVKIENYNIEIHGRYCYHQPINDSIKQYDEIEKSIKRPGWWLYNKVFIRFCLFRKKNRLIAADLSK